MRNDFYVYVVFRENGIPCYVGKGCKKRFLVHQSRSSNSHLRSIAKKAAGELPVVKVRENLTETEAFEIEIAFIRAIGRKKDGGPLVNLTDGGGIVSGLSPESLAAKAAAAKRAMQNPEFRAAAIERLEASRDKLNEIRKTPEFKQKLRDAHLGRALPDNQKENIRKAHLGQKRSEGAKQAMKEAAVKRFSDPAERKKISDAKKGIKFTDEHRRNLSLSHQGKSVLGFPKSEETRAKISTALNWRRRSAEAIQKHRETNAAKRAAKVKS